MIKKGIKINFWATIAFMGLLVVYYIIDQIYWASEIGSSLETLSLIFSNVLSMAMMIPIIGVAIINIILFVQVIKEDPQ